MNVQNRQIGKSTETKSKLVAKEWIEKGMESIANGYGVSLPGDKKKFWNYYGDFNCTTPWANQRPPNCIYTFKG